RGGRPRHRRRGGGGSPPAVGAAGAAHGGAGGAGVVDERARPGRATRPAGLRGRAATPRRRVRLPGRLRAPAPEPGHRARLAPGRRARAGRDPPMIELFDTHAHLQFPEFAADLDGVLARARTAGVTQLVTVGTDVETSRAAVELAARDPDIFAAVGVHPHDAA